MFNSSLNNNVTLRDVIPDFSAGVAKALNTDYTAETQGLIVGKAAAYINNTGIITINGIQFNQSTAGPVYGNSFTLGFFVDIGDVYKLNIGELVFYPLKGVN